LQEEVLNDGQPMGQSRNPGDMIFAVCWLNRIRANTWTITVVVSFALFMDNFIYGLIIPLTPYSPVKLASEGHAGLLFGGYAIGVLIATPLFGYLGDRIGNRRPFISGVALSGAAVCLMCLAPNFPLLFLGRLCLGAASAGTWIAAGGPATPLFLPFPASRIRSA